MTGPLKSWRCDSCGDEINDPSTALVIARYDDLKPFDWLIVHKGDSCDPGASAGYMLNVSLSSFLGEEGLAHLLALLSPGPIKGGSGCRIANFEQYVDLVRRVQTPYYEEARTKFDDEDVHHQFGDANEYYPYVPKSLRNIAQA